MLIYDVLDWIKRQKRAWQLYSLGRSICELHFIAEQCLDEGLTSQSKKLREVAEAINCYWMLEKEENKRG